MSGAPQYFAVELLKFAIEHVERDTRELIDSNKNRRTGEIDDPDVAEQIEAQKAWLASAKSYMRLDKQIKRLLKKFDGTA